ncbi:endonuclease/exonuclease/phosphatase family protein [Halochromatium glycolicum]|uniref:Dockerin domain-containing protein n=1 Tax=Halochromatium glycolicum TaxID=85075 RepID=A0AAJ0U3P7_9GAMM|nr:endonuclease/exonuclease/phosphatase family protein [Halochromatium glycolicum]MBK1704696.1 hypothetical protein [Halochromatium glycolicum]
MFSNRQRRIGTLVLVLDLGIGLIGTATAETVINEVVGSTTGADVEFVELYGVPGSSLAGISLIVVESDDIAANGAIDFQYDFATGDALGDNGFFLVGNDSVFATYGVAPNRTIEANAVENSSYTIALVQTSSIAGANVTGNEIVLDALGVFDGDAGDAFFFGAPVIGPDGRFLPAGGRRAADGIDTDTATDWVLADFFLTNNFPTAGTGDLGGNIASASIPEIQGAGHSSPFAGEEVTTDGVVTAVDSNGFYLQDPEGDGDLATSDALFVFTGSAPGVAVGDAVTVTGLVSEFIPGGPSTGNLSTTEIVGNPEVTITASGVALPAPVVIGNSGRIAPSENIDDDAFGAIAGLGDFDPTTDGIDFFESLEGMLVTAEDLVAVAGTNRFGEIFAANNQGSSATGLSLSGTLNISPDDFNPERIQVNDNSDIFDFAFPEVAVGDRLGDVTGVIGSSFGNFEIYPVEDFSANVVSADLLPGASNLFPEVRTLLVASYNVLNLDPNDADGDTDVADGRFDTIAEQIVQNLNAPDIIGLQEIQDNSGSVDDGTISADLTLQTLADAIVHAGGPAYAYLDNTFIGDNTSGGQPGANIRTAFLYNPARVSLVPRSIETIGSQEPGGAFFDARLPLVADFLFNGQAITVVVNHFSSKSGSAPILGVEQPFEARQEEVTVNGSLDERQTQSAAVQGFVGDLLAADPAAKIVVLGDFNEFEFVSPLLDLEDTGLTNLTWRLDENERYSFIFQGNSQSLDHILVSDSLVDAALFDIVHLNAEFAETASRASDHEPLLAALAFSALQGDADGNGVVNRADLNILRSYLRQPADNCKACDLDGDGVVSIRDARLLILELRQ